MSSEDLEVGLAVSYESFDVVMGAFKGFWPVHEDRLHLADGGKSVVWIHAGRSLGWGSFIIIGTWEGVPVRSWSGVSERVTARFLPCSQVLDLLFQAIGSLAFVVV